MKTKLFLACVAITLAAPAQQPNSLSAALIINGAGGPSYPINTTIETSIPASALMLGSANSPFAVFQSATGMAQPGAGSVSGNIIDLPLSPPPLAVINGFSQPGYHMSVLGQASFSATIPQSFAGTTVAWQMLCANPLLPAGFALSAATQAAFVPGVVTIPLSLGDDGFFALNVAPMQLPFYGTNYSTLHLSANGYLTFVAPVSDFTPSEYDFNAGPPRIAGFWTDLQQTPTGSITATVHQNSNPTAPGYARITFTNVVDWQGFGPPHTFSMQIWANGMVQIAHSPSNLSSIFDTITGIGAGQFGIVQPEKDLSALLSPNAYMGAPFESFYQWFGIVTLNPYYTQADDPYDLAGKTLSFIPVGTGPLLQSTMRYLMY